MPTTSTTPAGGPSAAPEHEAPERDRWMVAGIALLRASALVQLVYSMAALAGIEALQENVRKIETTPDIGGSLFLSLGGWGVVLLLVGLGELAAARSLARGAVFGRVAGLLVALLGLGASCFTLALFHVAALVTILLQLAALYVLSYRIEDPAA